MEKNLPYDIELMKYKISVIWKRIFPTTKDIFVEPMTSDYVLALKCSTYLYWIEMLI